MEREALREKHLRFVFQGKILHDTKTLHELLEHARRIRMWHDGDGLDAVLREEDVVDRDETLVIHCVVSDINVASNPDARSESRVYLVVFLPTWNGCRLR